MTQQTATISALTARNHLLFWTGAFVFFLLLVWLFSDILLPFVLGLAIAYLLDPLVKVLGRRRVPRWAAALVILGLFMAFVLLVLALILPPLYRETAELAEALPGYIERLPDLVAPYSTWLQQTFEQTDFTAYREAVQDNLGKAAGLAGGLITGIASGGQAVLGALTTLVLTPIVAFFMMNEWERITSWIDSLLPRAKYETIRGLIRQIDSKLAGFVRGQITVAFVLAVIYAVALTLAGLKFGFLIGLGAGILSIVPLVGSTLGLLVSVVVAWLQSGEWGYVGLIAGIFLAGQFFEGNILTPKLLGKSVGLHPLWILFALLAGGSLFGIVGMLLAVPVAATIGVLGGFAISEYKKSPYYTDGGKGTKAPPKTGPRPAKKKAKE